ncbi:hypothetical protein BH10PSE15_BH10PSE15_05710 [soil metagenome]
MLRLHAAFVEKSAWTRNSLNIVVGADDALIGELLGELLAETGNAACAIENSVGGVIAAASRFVPDLVIVDLHLVGGRGIDAVEAIIRHRPVAAILVSGNIMKLPAAKPQAICLAQTYGQVSLARAIRQAVGSGDHAVGRSLGG